MSRPAQRDPAGLPAIVGRAAPRYAAGLAAGVLAAASMLGLLGVAGWFITASALAGAGLMQLAVVFPSAWVRALALGRTGFRYLERLWTHQATLQTLAELRVHAFRAAAARPVQRRSDLLGRLGREVDHLDTLPLRLVQPCLVAALSGTGVLFFLSVTAPDVVWPATLLLLAVFATVLATAAANLRAGRRRVGAQAAARRRLVDVLEGWPEIQLHGLAGQARTELEAALARARGASRVIDRSVSMAAVAIGLLGAALVALAAGRVLVGTSGSVATATAVVLVVVGLVELLLPLADAGGYAGTAASAAARVAAVLRTPAGVTAQRDLRWPAVPTLHAGDVVPGHAIPDGVTFTAHPGALVLVTGPSAAGKTTLLQTLAGHRAPASGRVLIGDYPVDEISHGERHAHVCLVPQQPYLFTGTVADNLQIAAPDATADQMMAALAAVDLADLVADLTAGLDTPVGVRGERLSGGQARRLTIARAVLRRPAILLLDEPTVGVDPATADTMFSRLRRHLPDCIVVLAQHGHATDWPRLQPDITVSLAPSSARPRPVGADRRG